MHPIRENGPLYSTQRKKINDSCYVYHFPKNIAGVTELKEKGKRNKTAPETWGTFRQKRYGKHGKYRLSLPADMTTAILFKQDIVMTKER